VTDAFVDLL